MVPSAEVFDEFIGNDGTLLIHGIPPALTYAGAPEACIWPRKISFSLGEGNQEAPVDTRPALGLLTEIKYYELVIHVAM